MTGNKLKTLDCRNKIDRGTGREPETLFGFRITLRVVLEVPLLSAFATSLDVSRCAPP